jgi:hypothetical protein
MYVSQDSIKNLENFLVFRQGRVAKAKGTTSHCSYASASASASFPGSSCSSCLGGKEKASCRCEAAETEKKGGKSNARAGSPRRILAAVGGDRFLVSELRASSPRFQVRSNPPPPGAAAAANLVRRFFLFACFSASLRVGVGQGQAMREGAVLASSRTRVPSRRFLSTTNTNRGKGERGGAVVALPDPPLEVKTEAFFVFLSGVPRGSCDGCHSPPHWY